MSAVAAAADLPGGRGTGLARTAWAEWTKLVTLPSNLLLLGALAAALPLLSALVAATGSLQPGDTVLGASVLSGAVLAQLLAAVLGAGLATSEFGTGLILTTLAACPRRLVVLGAEAVVALAAVYPVALGSAIAAHLLGRAMLQGAGHAEGDAWPALLGVALAISQVAVLASASAPSCAIRPVAWRP